MKIESIDIQATIEKAQTIVREDKQMSAATKTMFEVLILVITLLVNRLGQNSTNSSKPPSTDPNRTRQDQKKTGRKPGGQKGHVGTTLQKIDNPDRVEEIKIDRRKLPPGQYRQVGYETRQVFDIDISRVVTEYRAQILENENGHQFVASFPDGVTKAVQYGNSIKAHSVYMSQFQLVPYNRIQDYFKDQIQVPVSEGSIFNFNKEAYHLLAEFEEQAKSKLRQSKLAHADETGINIGGKRHWLHGISNELWTFYYPHEKRGTDAMNEMGILSVFAGILCHDHWKPYYTYNCTHDLCNSHHLRELTRAFEQDNQKWALEMKELLETINHKVINAGGVLNEIESKKYRQEYRDLIKKAEEECPEPDRPKEKGNRGRIKKSKSRNLLERLRNFEEDVLRFMDIDYVPFSNNLAENDIRMTKVQQKISGCFRSMEGAKIFCRVRSYLSTCRKHGISATEALRSLLDGKKLDALA